MSTHQSCTKKTLTAFCAPRTAVQYAPNPAAAAAVLSNLGALLLSAGRLEECLEVIDSCMLLSSRAGLQRSMFYAGASFNKGKALGMLGKAEEAAAVFVEAIEASRKVSPGTFTKAYASLHTFTSEQIADMEAALQYLQNVRGSRQPGSTKPKRQRPGREAALAADWDWLQDTSKADESWLHFALFSAYQKQGNYQKAWEQLDVANRLQHGSEGHTSGQDATLLKALTSAFPPISRDMPSPLRPDAYQALMSGQAGHDSRVPIFVVGMPRSGSTLVEQILASHSQVFGAGEDTALAPLIPDLLQALSGEGGLDAARVAVVGRKYVSQMQAKAARYRKQDPDAVGAAKPKPYKRIVDKMLRNAWNLGHISVMLPAAKVLHVVRHPMDVTLSCYAQPFEGRGTPWAWDLAEIADQILLTHQVMDHWDTVLPEGRILRVPYEVLVTDQEAMTRRILDFVGLAWEPGVLRFHETARAVQTASLGQVRQKLYTSAVGKWRHYEQQLQPAYRLLRDLIERYEDDLKDLQSSSRATDEL